MKNNEETQTNICKCGCNGTKEHTCPFEVEINGDEDFKCNCCDTCETECAMDT